jgi:hypothetical protein
MVCTLAHQLAAARGGEGGGRARGPAASGAGSHGGGHAACLALGTMQRSRRRRAQRSRRGRPCHRWGRRPRVSGGLPGSFGALGSRIESWGGGAPQPRNGFGLQGLGGSRFLGLRALGTPEDLWGLGMQYLDPTPFDRKPMRPWRKVECSVLADFSSGWKANGIWLVLMQSRTFDSYLPVPHVVCHQ